MTSVTTNRSRRFTTPVGLFIYRQIALRAFPVGMIRVEADHNQAFLIALPEKALADKVVSVRGVSLNSIKEMAGFLEEDLRIDIEAIKTLSAERIDDFAAKYRSQKLKLLAGFIRRLKAI